MSEKQCKNHQKKKPGTPNAPAKIIGNQIVQKLIVTSLHSSVGYSMSAFAELSPVALPQYAQISETTGAPQEGQVF